MNESWEHVWSEREKTGFFHRAGSFLAAHCDLQFIVLRELARNCVLSGSPRVLEVGCGTASVLKMLRKYTDDLYGIDVSSTAAAISSEISRTAVADGRALPFPDGSFDIVFSTGVLDLFETADAELFLVEMDRVLKTGGRAVVTTARCECRLHRTVMEHLVKRGRWKYGSKKCFSSLSGIVPEGLFLVDEYGRGAVFQLRFISYLFESSVLLRRFYNGLFLLISLVLRPLNRFPGALLVTVMEKK